MRAKRGEFCMTNAMKKEEFSAADRKVIPSWACALAQLGIRNTWTLLPGFKNAPHTRRTCNKTQRLTRLLYHNFKRPGQGTSLALMVKEFSTTKGWRASANKAWGRTCLRGAAIEPQFWRKSQTVIVDRHPKGILPLAVTTLCPLIRRPPSTFTK